MHLNRRLTAALAVIAAVSLAGGAYAATQGSPAQSRDTFLNDVAKRLHVTPAQLSSALQGAYDDQLNAQVAAGHLSRAQADAIEKAVKQHGGVPLGGFAFGLGPGGPAQAQRPQSALPRLFAPPAKALPWSARPGTAGTRARPATAFGFRLGLAFGVGPFGAGNVVKAAESYLGLSGAKIVGELRSGKSLAAIATAQGKTAAGLESAVTAAIKAALDKAVSAKRITSAQETEILARLSSILPKVVDATAPKLLGTWRARAKGPALRSFHKFRGGFWAQPGLPVAPGGGPPPASGSARRGSGRGSGSGSGGGSGSGSARSGASVPLPAAASPAPPPSA